MLRGAIRYGTMRRDTIPYFSAHTARGRTFWYVYAQWRGIILCCAVRRGTAGAVAGIGNLCFMALAFQIESRKLSKDCILIESSVAVGRRPTGNIIATGVRREHEL